jgi:hypothetical protein
MNHEEIQQGTQYTVNADRPYESQLDKGMQVVVVGEFPTPFTNHPCNFRVESVRDREAGGFVPVWILSCDNLDPANTTYDPETGEAIQPAAEGETQTITSADVGAVPDDVASAS